MSEEKHHIVPYGFYIFILFALISFTLVSVYVTTIDLGQWSVFTALALATVKSVMVLLYFMHLKFDKPIYRIMFFLVLAVFIAVILITLLDYVYRQ
jgi:cytochrome c oxidase subunit 4